MASSAMELQLGVFGFLSTRGNKCKQKCIHDLLMQCCISHIFIFMLRPQQLQVMMMGSYNARLIYPTSDYPSFAVRKRYHVKLSLINTCPTSSPPFSCLTMLIVGLSFIYTQRFHSQPAIQIWKQKITCLLQNTLSVSNKDPNYFYFSLK